MVGRGGKEACGCKSTKWHDGLMEPEALRPPSFRQTPPRHGRSCDPPANASPSSGTLNTADGVSADPPDSIINGNCPLVSLSTSPKSVVLLCAEPARSDFNRCAGSTEGDHKVPILGDKLAVARQACLSVSAALHFAGLSFPQSTAFKPFREPTSKQTSGCSTRAGRGYETARTDGTCPYLDKGFLEIGSRF